MSNRVNRLQSEPLTRQELFTGLVFKPRTVDVYFIISKIDKDKYTFRDAFTGAERELEFQEFEILSWELVSECELITLLDAQRSANRKELDESRRKIKDLEEQQQNILNNLKAVRAGYWELYRSR